MIITSKFGQFSEYSKCDSKHYLYPNPTNGIVTIEHPDMELITVFDIMGKMVNRIEVAGKESQTIDLSALQNGTYFIRIETKDGIRVSKVVRR